MINSSIAIHSTQLAVLCTRALPGTIGETIKVGCWLPGSEISPVIMYGLSLSTEQGTSKTGNWTSGLDLNTFDLEQYSTHAPTKLSGPHVICFFGYVPVLQVTDDKLVRIVLR